MQNRYAGDVGDFGKLGLLRQIASLGFVIGVNWYLAPDEANNNDGKHTGYLTDRRFDGCDDALRSSLYQLVKSERSVSAIEKQDLIPRAVYYNEMVLSPTEAFSRQKWHANAVDTLKHSNVVFLDPDNGVLVKSVSIGSKKSNKYLLPSEISDYYAAGKSVIFYNHRCRQKESVYLQRFKWMQEDLILGTAYLAGMKFVRGTIRDYLFILQPNHAAKIIECIGKMLQSSWGKHFFIMEV